MAGSAPRHSFGNVCNIHLRSASNPTCTCTVQMRSKGVFCKQCRTSAMGHLLPSLDNMSTHPISSPEPKEITNVEWLHPGTRGVIENLHSSACMADRPTKSWRHGHQFWILRSMLWGKFTLKSLRLSIRIGSCLERGVSTKPILCQQSNQCKYSPQKKNTTIQVTRHVGSTGFN
jgi:hypothetical protein